jgi:hypothetical protein
MKAEPHEIQRALLKVLSYPTGYRLTELIPLEFYEAVQEQCGDVKAPGDQVNAGIWSLVQQGLVFLNFVSDGTGGKRFDADICLTEAGKRAANEENSSPDNPDVYWERFVQAVPSASPIAIEYASEAMRAYRMDCNLAAVVMLGVCSEAAFLETAQSFESALGSTPSGVALKFRNAFKDSRQNIKQKADTFREAVSDTKLNIPYAIREGIENHWSGIFHLIRVNRNNAGHPTRANITREDARDLLIMLPHNLRRMYELKEHCDSKGTI